MKKKDISAIFEKLGLGNEEARKALDFCHSPKPQEGQGQEVMFIRVENASHAEESLVNAELEPASGRD